MTKRYFALDTETTGLHNSKDRIVEIAGVELIDRHITGEYFHYYINPECDVPEEVVKIHGLSYEFLKDKPIFAEIAPLLIEKLKGASLIIHNAKFDIGFMNMEFSRFFDKNVTENDYCDEVIDTLELARATRPGKKHSLDALCSHYNIDASKRHKHGALIDSELLAQVYLALTRRQNSLEDHLTQPAEEAIQTAKNFEMIHDVALKQLFSRHSIENLSICGANQEELEAHTQYLAELEKKNKQRSIWSKIFS